SQGMSNAEIGALFAAPVLAQAPLNLVGGAYTDRIGGRLIMLGSCFVVIAAGIWFIFAHGFWMLMAGQVALILSRAAFWPATWAMASELPGERGLQLGRLNAVTNFGQIVGTVLCGFVLAAAGFQATFAVLAVAAAAGLVPTVNHVAPIAFWMLVVGAGTAAMTLYFQITISEASAPAERGSALALGGLGWSVSHLSTPLIMGFLADRYGIVAGFYVLGGFALVGALVIALTRRWAFQPG